MRSAKPGANALVSTVARIATVSDCTTCRVELISAEARETLGPSTVASAVTKVVCTVSPNANPRSASRKSSQLIEVSKVSCESCQVLMTRIVKPMTTSGRAPILS